MLECLRAPAAHASERGPVTCGVMVASRRAASAISRTWSIDAVPLCSEFRSSIPHAATAAENFRLGEASDSRMSASGIGRVTRRLVLALFIEPDTSIRKTRLFGGASSSATRLPCRPMWSSFCPGAHGHCETSVVKENGAPPSGSG